MDKPHDIRTYHDGYKNVRYCAECWEENEQVLYGEPCKGKLTDIPKKPVDIKDEKA